MRIGNLKKIGIGIGLLISLGGCETSNPPTETDKPTVVATSTIIADWTKRIGDNEINLVGILEPGDDPHIYEPVPRDTQRLEEADLILYNGYHLEPQLIKLIQATGENSSKLAVGEVVPPLGYEDEEQIVPDPHVWGNVENAVLMVEAIQEKLITLSPEDETLYRENLDQLAIELTALHNWIQEQIDTIPPENRQLVTTHDAFQYYAETYGLEVVGTLIGISTEEKPSAKTVKNLVEEVKQANVPVIFAETTINPALIETVAQEAEVKVADQELYADSIGASGTEADSYIKMMALNTKTIVRNLGGDYTPFTSSQ